jgi:hypothetical protein
VVFFTDAGALPQLRLFSLAPVFDVLISGYLTRWLHNNPD